MTKSDDLASDSVDLYFAKNDNVASNLRERTSRETDDVAFYFVGLVFRGGADVVLDSAEHMSRVASDLMERVSLKK